MSQTQRLLLNALISMIITAAVAALQAVLQLNSGNDQLNVSVMVNTGLVVFFTTLTPSLLNYIPAHIQDELQALRDLQSQITGKSVTPAATTQAPTTPTEEQKQLV